MVLLNANNHNRREIAYGLAYAVIVARTEMFQPSDMSIVRAFTMRLNEIPNDDSVRHLADLARINGFSLHIGDDFYVYGVDEKRVYKYSVIWFLNECPPR